MRRGRDAVTSGGLGKGGVRRLRKERGTVTKRRQPAESGSVIERVVFRCILSLAVASVAAVLILSVVGPSP